MGSFDTKKCKACKMDIPREAKVCPYCHKKQSYRSRMTPGIILISVIVVLIIAFFAWINSLFLPKTTASLQFVYVAQEAVKSIPPLFL